MSRWRQPTPRPVRPTLRRPLPHRGRRGAAILEAALILPVFLLVVFGVLDTADVMYRRTVLHAAVGDASRAAVIRPSSTDADLRVVRAIARRTADLDDVIRLVVYRSDIQGGGPSAACRAGTGDANCVVYTGAQVRAALAAGTLACSGALPQLWCPSAANRAPTTPIGVYVLADLRGPARILPIGQSEIFAFAPGQMR